MFSRKPSSWRYTSLSPSDGGLAPRKRWSHSLRLTIILMLPLSLVVLALFWTQISENSSLSPTKISCTDPATRREWRSLSRREKKDYIDAVKCLATVPSRLGTNGTIYDDFPWAHTQVSSFTHGSASFFPWHRYFIHAYERALREHCHYEGNLAYWDWTLDWENITRSPVWGPESGFGGDGNKTGEITLGHGRCIVDGPFAGQVALFYGTRYDPHCLSRGFGNGDKEGEFSGIGVRPEVVENILKQDSYEKFFLDFENGPHSVIPNGVRGDFFSFTAPYDPVFFLHHTQLDRLWWVWQKTDFKKRVKAYGGRITHHSNEQASLKDILHMGGLVDNLPVMSVMSTESDLLCYKY
ncbi:Di-copper centre-containing protein [Hyaloscypha hepaticicola]|uniref:Di-copper centre-containing protein n=1 Tax=Hyaloscypha hepaticicola TaxID=2082293 RepID=A0A2J6PRK0_9HELO|nr:Di-copper centre-containing protein [Hyaloscypha hepaticicola]